MSALRSFIVRIYRRGPGGGLSGTVQPVGGAAQAPVAFANAAELLHQMKAGPLAAAPATPTTPAEAHDPGNSPCPAAATAAAPVNSARTRRRPG